jgi:hypothetical protein
VQEEKEENHPPNDVQLPTIGAIHGPVEEEEAIQIVADLEDEEKTAAVVVVDKDGSELK